MFKNLSGNLLKNLNESIWGSGFTVPAATDSLILWKDANDEDTVTKNGSNEVSAVADKSANGNDSVNSGTVIWNPTGFNGKPCFDFGASALFLTHDASMVSANDQYDVFVVYGINNFEAAKTKYIFYKWGTSGKWQFIFQIHTSGTYRLNSTNDGTAVNGSLDATNATPGSNQTHLVNFYSDPSPQRTEMAIDAVSEGGYDYKIFTEGTANAGVFIGHAVYPTFTTKVAEVLWYDKKLSPAERTQTVDYLMTKWRL